MIQYTWRIESDRIVIVKFNSNQNVHGIIADKDKIFNSLDDAEKNISKFCSNIDMRDISRGNTLSP